MNIGTHEDKELLMLLKPGIMDWDTKKREWGHLLGLCQSLLQVEASEISAEGVESVSII
jgi:hypothetical protein